MSYAEEPWGADIWVEVIIEQRKARKDHASRVGPLALSHKSEQSVKGN